MKDWIYNYRFVLMFLLLFGLTFKGYAVNNNKNSKPKKVLMVGGGSSHDFERWYKGEDLQLINSMQGISAFYTDNTDSIKFYLKDIDLLILTNNQPISKESQQAIEKYVAKGGPLILMHAALWYNWNDWPKYNTELVGGGSTSHETFQLFKNLVVNPVHPITAGVASQFDFKDELYRHVPEPNSLGLDVLVIGESLETGKVYPVVFTVNHSKSKIVGITLGHDEHSHLSPDYKKIVRNSVEWIFK